MVALALSLRPLGPPPMPARGGAREPAHFSRPSRAVQTPHELPGLASDTCKVFFYSLPCKGTAKGFRVPTWHDFWKKKKKKAPQLPPAALEPAVCFPDWLSAESRVLSRKIPERGGVTSHSSHRPQQPLGRRNSAESWWVLVCQAGVPGCLQHSGYCVLRETGFQNKQPLAFSPCHPVWNIKCRLQRGHKKCRKQAVQRRWGFGWQWIFTPVFTYFVTNAGCRRLYYCVYSGICISCNYATKELISPGNLKQWERQKRT